MTIIDFPDDVPANDPVTLLGANATDPAKAAITSAGLAMLAAADVAAQVALLDAVTKAGTQTITGAKTFSAAPTISALTSTRIPIAGTAGLIGDSPHLKFNGVSLFIGDGVTPTDHTLVLSSPTAQYLTLALMRGTLDRWTLAVDNFAESGGNAGSRLKLGAWDDAGANIDFPIVFERPAGGLMTLARPISETNTTEASAVGTAAHILAGGLGVAKRSFLGTIASTFAGNIIAGVQDGTGGVAGTAGQVGELKSSTVSAAAVAATGTPGDADSITLTRGCWFMTANAVIHGGATGLTAGSTVKLSINENSATNGSSGDTMSQCSVPVLLANGITSLVVPGFIVNISTPTTYYLVEEVTYVAGSPTVDASLIAMRIR